MIWLTEESNRFSSVKKAMVVSEGDDHDGSDDNLPIYHNWSLLDGVHTYNGT